MVAELIDGKAQALRLTKVVRERALKLSEERGRAPSLAVVLVGNNPASEIYVRNKVRSAAIAGMNSFEHRLPGSTTEADLLSLLKQLNADPTVDGILVQLPLPSHIETRTILEAVDPFKDVDGFHPANVGATVVGAKGVVPCTPLGIRMLLREHTGDLTGAHAVVVGSSNIVGKPIAALLLQEKCTVTTCHIHTRRLSELTRQADILITAAGSPNLIRGDWIKPGATVIDVGINRVATSGRSSPQTKIVGDVAFHEARDVAAAITPVPGGVGPMTIACLLHNTVDLAERQYAVARQVR
jgi:methylenetetrahydrofolate dehydrogenase (NADP+)/methenyltetrahydrofolate cyclohydrolase